MSIPKHVIAFYKLDQNVKPPRRATSLSAGWDLYASESKTFKAWSRGIVGTGISLGMPAGIYGRLAARSSFALAGLDVGAGVIDPDYNGEVKVLIINNSDDIKQISKGERFAQIVFEHYHEPKDILVFNQVKKPLEEDLKSVKNEESNCSSSSQQVITNSDEKPLEVVHNVTHEMVKSVDGLSKFHLYAENDIIIPAKERYVYSTGVSLCIPGDVYGHLVGTAILADFGLDVTEAVIQNDSPKSIEVVINNKNSFDYKVRQGIPIAVIHFKSFAINLTEAYTKAESETRSDEGFGSTGKQ